jgi:hypothetical protein
MTIRKIENGYVTTDKHGYETYYPDAQALFDGLLMAFESKSSAYSSQHSPLSFSATTRPVGPTRYQRPTLRLHAPARW